MACESHQRYGSCSQFGVWPLSPAFKSHSWWGINNVWCWFLNRTAIMEIRGCYSLSHYPRSDGIWVPLTAPPNDHWTVWSNEWEDSSIFMQKSLMIIATSHPLLPAQNLRPLNPMIIAACLHPNLTPRKWLALICIWSKDGCSLLLQFIFSVMSGYHSTLEKKIKAFILKSHKNKLVTAFIPVHQ